MSKKKQDIVIVICVITLVLSVCAIFCIYYSNKNDEFIFNEHLDEIVLTVKDDENSMNISLQEIAYYIINVEGDVDDMAHQFNSENLHAYWNVKLDKGLYTMRKYAKDLVIEKCVMDNIYYSPTGSASSPRRTRAFPWHGTPASAMPGANLSASWMRTMSGGPIILPPLMT